MSDQNSKSGASTPTLIPALRPASSLNPALTSEGLPEEFSAIWVESVMTKLPLHTLSTQGQMQVRIEKRDEGGEVTLLWQVSPSQQFGEPRHLAYRLDTLVINKRIDEAGPPTPKVIRLGSLRSICRELGLSESGHNFTDIKQALSQNASATIKAKVFYRDREGRRRKLEAVFSRYSVIFSGDTLPDGTEADGVYVVMNDIYQGFLNHVPLRPLDFKYLRQLSPSACRFYEVVSFRIYAALKHGWPKVSLAYSEYCEATGQRRLLTGTEVSKQMYKLHKPHLDSGYLAKAEFERTVDDAGQPDWNIWYIPGPRAKDEYVKFSSGREVSDTVLETDSHLLPRGQSPAEELVTHFLTIRFGKVNRRIAAKELEMADELLKIQNLDRSKKVLSEALTSSIAAGVKPLWMTELKEQLKQTGQTAKR
ncbi:MAG TPA: hypothetical protein VJ302_04345 [Blastocatellia bacterium]|nr:hypothetical protein [Blastocatellia bacterium]